jgi:hypothetical protein
VIRKAVENDEVEWGYALWLPIPLYIYSEHFRVEEIGVK